MMFDLRGRMEEGCTLHAKPECAKAGSMLHCADGPWMGWSD